MSFTRQQFAKVVPTLPTGEPIASYPTYAEAQKAIAYLADQHFPVESLTIVGTDLRSVERVTGRLSYGRVAIAGAMSGAWFGLFVGLMLSLFGGTGLATGIGFISVLIGAGFGLLFSVLSYAMTRSRRDFTSSSQIVAGQYAVLCIPGVAHEARRMLLASPVGIGRSGAGVSAGTAAGVGGGGGGGTMPQPVATKPVVPPQAAVGELTTYLGPPPPAAGAAVVVPVEPVVVAAPVAPKIDLRWVTPDGKPKFGALASDHPGVELPKKDEPAVVVPVAPVVVAPPTNSSKKDPFDNDPFAPPKR